jgi:hypothetical protein
MTTGEAIETIIREILKYEKATHNFIDHHDNEHRLTAAEFRGTVVGLRLALCAIYGWSTDESDTEGLADQLVRSIASAYDE